MTKVQSCPVSKLKVAALLQSHTPAHWTSALSAKPKKIMKCCHCAPEQQNLLEICNLSSAQEHGRTFKKQIVSTDSKQQAAQGRSRLDKQLELHWKCTWDISRDSRSNVLWDRQSNMLWDRQHNKLWDQNQPAQQLQMHQTSCALAQH